MRSVGVIAGVPTALLAAIVVAAPGRPAAAAGTVSDAEALAIVARHCTMCHAAKPTHESFEEAPKGVALETIEELRRYAKLIYAQTVQSRAMPLGNQTGMTEKERTRLGQWARAQR